MSRQLRSVCAVVANASGQTLGSRMPAPRGDEGVPRCETRVARAPLPEKREPLDRQRLGDRIVALVVHDFDLLADATTRWSVETLHSRPPRAVGTASRVSRSAICR